MSNKCSNGTAFMNDSLNFSDKKRVIETSNLGRDSGVTDDNGWCLRNSTDWILIGMSTAQFKFIGMKYKTLIRMTENTKLVFFPSSLCTLVVNENAFFMKI